MMKKQVILNIWKSHFEKHLNTQFPHDEDALREFEPEAENVTEYISPIIKKWKIPSKGYLTERRQELME